MRISFPTRRRLLTTAAGLLAAAALASSCSLDAAVATDRSGRVIGIYAVQIRSEALDLALALAVQSRRLILELRWRQAPGSPTSGGFP